MLGNHPCRSYCMTTGSPWWLCCFSLSFPKASKDKDEDADDGSGDDDKDEDEDASSSGDEEMTAS